MHYWDKSLHDKLDLMHETMFDSCGYFFIRDLAGRYLYVNKNMLDAADRSMSELVGKRDAAADLPWAKYIDMYARYDKIAIPNKEPIKVMEMIETHEEKTFLVYAQKKAFYHNGEKIGLVGIAIESPDASDSLNASFSEVTVFFNVKREKVIDFTKKQRLVAAYLLKGFSVVDIAAQLFLSKRTVEHHVDAMKYKSECTSIKEFLLFVRMV